MSNSNNDFRIIPTERTTNEDGTDTYSLDLYGDMKLICRTVDNEGNTVSEKSYMLKGKDMSTLDD